MAKKSRSGSPKPQFVAGAKSAPVRPSRFTMLALEPRFMFDGAAVATAAEGVSNASGDTGWHDTNRDVVAEPQGIEAVEPAMQGRSPGQGRSEIVFVDTRVTDYQAIIEAISPSAEVVLLNTGRDGVAQMAEALAGRENVEAIHVVSHGDEGVLLLGDAPLHQGNMDRYAEMLAGIGQSLTETGDIHLWGCNVGGGDKGQDFLSALADATGADIAASSDSTGGAEGGGDWELEITTGAVAASTALDTARLAGYGHQLATFSVDTIEELRTALSLSATNHEADIITFTGDIAANGFGDMSPSATDGHETFVDINITDGQALDIVGGGYSLDANFYGRVLEVRAGEVDISNLTIRDGLISGDGGSYNSLDGESALGAGIKASGGTLNLSGVTITGNRATGGGGNGGGYSYGGGYGYGGGGAGGGGGGGGFAGIGGGDGGAYSGSFPGGVGGGGMGGMGGAYSMYVQAGKGGGSIGGDGGITIGGGSSGGAGGTAGIGGNTIGGGGAGAGASQAPAVGRGGNAVGAFYIGDGATANVVNTTVIDNYGAGGGGAGSSTMVNGADGGFGVGGIYVSGTLNYQSSTVDLVGTDNANYGAGGAGGGNEAGHAPGSAGSGYNTGSENFSGPGVITSNYSPNLAPVIDANGAAGGTASSPTFIEDGGAVRIVASDATLTDDDNITGMTLVLSTTPDGVQESISYNAALNGGASLASLGLTGGYNSAARSFTISGTASAAVYESVLRAMTYGNDSHSPDTGSRSVTISVMDAEGATGQTMASINITAVNDAPSATNLTQTKSYVEDGGAVALDDIVITDMDSSEIVTATLTMSVTSAGSLSTGTFGAATSTFNAGTGVWTVTGSVADVNAALAVVAFNPSQNYNQNFTITTRVRDAAGTGPADGVIMLNATPINDSPVLTVPPSISVTEDTATALTGISVSDVDAGSGAVTVTLSVPAGALAATSGAGVTASGTASVLTLNGTVADINAFLASGGVAYTSAANDTTSQTLTIVVSDNGNTGGGGGLSDTEVITLNIAAVNDAPVLTVPASIGVTEDTATALTGISVSDIDAGSNSVVVTLSVATGSLSATSGSGVTVGGTASSLTLSGSIADINAFVASARVVYTTAPNATADTTLTVTIDDMSNTGSGGSLQDSAAVVLTVSPVNDAPIVTTSGGSAAYTENSAPVVIDGALTLTDVDNATLASATVTIVGNFAGGQDVLSFVNDGTTMGNISASYNPATGTLTLTSAGATATVGQWQSALRAISYANTSDAPTTAARSISFMVSDGAANSSSAPRSVTVTAVNDAPTNDPAHGYVNTGTSTQTGGLVTITNGMLHEGDLDDSGAGITYTITEGPTGGVLFRDLDYDNVPDASEVLSASDSFTQNDVDMGLLKYRHGGGAGGNDGFTFSMADGGEDGASALTGLTFNIEVAERPVIGIGGGSPAYTEDGTATVVAPNLTITDGDSANMTGAQVRIDDVVAGDMLNCIAESGITVTYDAVTGVLTLAGTATRDQYQQMLRSVSYSSTNDDPATGTGNGDRVISFTVTDGSQTSTAVHTAVTIANTNDAPTLDAAHAPVLNGITEGAAPPVVGSTAGTTLVSQLLGGASDADTGALDGIAITDVSDQGILWYSLDGGTSWSIATGVSSVNALLLSADARLYFQPSENVDGVIADAVTFRAWDRTSGSNGGRADTTISGGSSAFSSVHDQASLVVSAVNDAPVISAPSVIGVIEDAASVLTGISVADVDAGAGSVTMTLSIPAGTLSATSGAGVMVGGTVSALTLTGRVADINAFLAGAGVTYTSAANDTGTRNLTVTVTDNGNTGSGGALSDTTTVSIAIAPVNDAPTATNLDQSKSYVEDQSSAVALDDIVITDVDTGELVTATLTLSDPAAGSLSTGTYGSVTSTFNANTGVWSVTGSVADVNAALATVAFKPAQNFDKTITITTRIRDAADAGPADGAVTLSATPINDAPVLAAPSSIAVTEDVATSLTGISIADVDAGTAPITVTLSVPAGALSATSGAGVMVGGTASALTLTGRVADINAFLAAAGVSYTSAANDTGTRILTVTVTDNGNSGSGGALSDTRTVNLAISAVNDAPVLTAPSSISMTEDVTTALTGISVADVDVGTAPITVTLSVPAGELSAASGAGVMVGGTANALTLTGAAADINAFLAGSRVTYAPLANDTGIRILTVTVTDHGNVGSGGALGDTKTVDLSIAPVNDAPTATNLTQSVVFTEDGGSVSFSAIVVSDADIGGTITATLTLNDPEAGVLSTGTFGDAVARFDAVNGVWTVTGTVADVNAALAATTFTPAANRAHDVVITTAVRDASGAGPADGTITLAAIPVNDAPTPNASLPDVTWRAGDHTLTLPADAFVDLEGDALTYSAALAGGAALPSWLHFDPGSRTLSGRPPVGGGSLTVVVTATDAQGATASSSFTLTYENPAVVAPPAIPAPIVSAPTPPPVVSSPAPILTVLRSGSESVGSMFAGSDNEVRASWMQGTPLLMASQPTMDLTVADGPFTVVLPPSLFFHMDPQARLQLEARLEDGSPLPAWLSFDPETGTFTGEPPMGTANLTLRVIARDLSGQQTEVKIRLDVGPKPNSSVDDASRPAQGDAANTSPESGDGRASREAGVAVAEQTAEVLPVGKPSFSQQLALARQGGLQARQAAFVEAAREVARITRG